MLDFVQKNVIFLVINDAAFDFIMHVFYAGDEGVIQIFKVYADYMRAGNAFWEKLIFYRFHQDRFSRTSYSRYDFNQINIIIRAEKF